MERDWEGERERDLVEEGKEKEDLAVYESGGECILFGGIKKLVFVYSLKDKIEFCSSVTLIITPLYNNNCSVFDFFLKVTNECFFSVKYIVNENCHMWGTFHSMEVQQYKA